MTRANYGDSNGPSEFWREHDATLRELAEARGLTKQPKPAGCSG